MAKYFTKEEFKCKCCGESKVSEELINRLDKLREKYGAPINVSCGYRCPKHNAEEGGVANSTHTQGLAADVWVGSPTDFSETAVREYKAFYKLALESQLFDGVGYYPHKLFVHLDIREGGKAPNKYQWNG